MKFCILYVKSPLFTKIEGKLIARMVFQTERNFRSLIVDFERNVWRRLKNHTTANTFIFSLLKEPRDYIVLKDKAKRLC